MVDFVYKDFYGVEDLVRIVALLRGPGGCPWDQVQTHESIRRNFLEEAYEVAEAIDQHDADHLKEELGDVLLQVVFHAGIEEEFNGLTLDDVADGVCKKLIYRHPHVFDRVQVSGTDEVLTNWEALKRTEKGQKSQTDVLRAVARSLPALWRAEKVQSKAEKAGWNWPDEAALQAELAEAAGQTGVDIGRILFAAVNLARVRGVDPEQALTDTTDEFIARFSEKEPQTT